MALENLKASGSYQTRIKNRCNSSQAHVEPLWQLPALLSSKLKEGGWPERFVWELKEYIKFLEQSARGKRQEKIRFTGR